jgi:hypothetical protein
MALIKKPPETIERIAVEEPGSRLLDDYGRFRDRTPHYVTNLALRKLVSRDSGYKKWKSRRTAQLSLKPAPACHGPRNP